MLGLEAPLSQTRLSHNCVVAQRVGGWLTSFWSVFGTPKADSNWTRKRDGGDWSLIWQLEEIRRKEKPVRCEEVMVDWPCRLPVCNVASVGWNDLAMRVRARIHVTIFCLHVFTERFQVG